MSPSRGANYGRHMTYGSSDDRESSRRRRPSPVYDDYPGYSEPGPSNDQGVTHESRNYTGTIKEADSHKLRSLESRDERPSPSPHRRGEGTTSSQSRFKPVLFAAENVYLGIDRRPRLRSSSPPATTRTNPTTKYLEIASELPTGLQDPSQTRKLVVLDLNGSLLLRSAHQRRPGRPDPYTDPTQLRSLRAVHRRPYLWSFVSYLLHDQTKKWLDAMIWSSAQPHSVADMADKCFGQRKSELKAIWARDTLGLREDEYHRKTQTFKDLEKPWSQLRSSDDSGSSVSLHSPRSTVLVDDSPLKAALQPWNHLCIKEYLQDMRKQDLAVAEWDAARQRAQHAREALELEESRRRQAEEAAAREKQQGEEEVQASLEDPNVTKMIREVVMVNGTMVGEEQVVKNVTREVAMVDGVMMDEQEQVALAPEPEQSASKKKRKLKRLAKKEAVLKAKEELEKKALLAQFDDDASNVEEGEIGVDDLVDEEAKLTALKDKMKFDETLLAVVGILDHLKHEANVAAWLRSGGLLRTVSEATDQETSIPSRSTSPPPSPTKRRRIDISSTHPSSPPPTSPPASSQASAFEVADPQTEQAVEKAEQFTGVPLTPSVDKHDSPHILWFDRPAVLTFWADRGRRALEELAIPIEHGIVITS